jgi:hypothetical protein
MPELKNFSLVGGTALSLLYGHSGSVDLDLFSNEPFENVKISEAMKNKLHDEFIMEQKLPHFGIFCYVCGVKVDLVRHPHPLIRPEQNHIAELLNHFSISDFIEFHKEKFATQNLLITVPQAITYFADAEESEDPISLKDQTWQSVQEFINSKAREYLK